MCLLRAFVSTSRYTKIFLNFKFGKVSYIFPFLWNLSEILGGLFELQSAQISVLALTFLQYEHVNQNFLSAENEGISFTDP